MSELDLTAPVPEGADVARRISAWLDERPLDHVLDRARAIRSLQRSLRSSDPEIRELRTQELVIRQRRLREQLSGVDVGELFAELVDDRADSGLEMRDGSVEQLASADQVPVFFGDVIDDLPSQDSQRVELGAGDVQRVGEVLDGHEGSSRVEGPALVSPSPVEPILEDAADTLGVGVEGAADSPGSAAPVPGGGEAS